MRDKASTEATCCVSEPYAIRESLAFVILWLDLESSCLEFQGEEGEVLDPGRGLDHRLGLAQTRKPLRRMNRDALGCPQDGVAHSSQLWIIGLDRDGVAIGPPAPDDLGGALPPDDALLHGASLHTVNSSWKDCALAQRLGRDTRFFLYDSS